MIDIVERNRDTRIKFRAHQLLELIPYMGNKDIRYYLNGIRVERAKDKDRGIYIVATNGHQMAVMYDPDGQIVQAEGGGVILRIPKEMQAAIRRIKSKDREKINVVVNGSRVSLAPDFGMEYSEDESYIQAGNPWIEGKFPNWARVLPEFDKLKPEVVVNMRSKYLTELMPRGSREFDGVRFWQDPDHQSGAMVVQFDRNTNLIVLLMPMRLEPNERAKEKLLSVFGAKKTMAADPPKAMPDPLTPELIDAAREHIRQDQIEYPGRVSVSMVQRKMQIPYAEAERIVNAILHTK